MSSYEEYIANYKKRYQDDEEEEKQQKITTPRVEDVEPSVQQIDSKTADDYESYIESYKQRTSEMDERRDIGQMQVEEKRKDITVEPEEEKGFFRKASSFLKNFFTTTIDAIKEGGIATTDTATEKIADTSGEVMPRGETSLKEYKAREKIGIESSQTELSKQEVIKQMVNDPLAYRINRPYYSSDEKYMQQDLDKTPMDVIEDKLQRYSEFRGGLTEVEKLRLQAPDTVTEDTYEYVMLYTDDAMSRMKTEVSVLEKRLETVDNKKDVKEIEDRISQLDYQISGLENIKSGITKNKGIIEGLVDFWDKENIPLVGGIFTAEEAITVSNAFKKYEEGGELSEREKRLIEEYTIGKEIEAIVNEYSTGYEITTGILGSIVFMAEFYIASLIPTPADDALIGATKVLPRVAKSGLQATKVTLTAGLPRIVTEATERQRPVYQYYWDKDNIEKVSEGEDPSDAWVKAFALEFGNNLIEIGLVGAGTAGSVAEEIVEKGAIDGFVTEFGEEMLQKFYEEAVINSKQFVLPDNLEDTKTQFTLTPREVVITGAVTLALGAINDAVRTGQMTQDQADSQIRQLEDRVQEVYNKAEGRTREQLIEDLKEEQKNNPVEGGKYSQLLEDVEAKEQKLEEKTFYHGTLEDFEEFSMEEAGKNTAYDNAKFGIFFTDQKEMAGEFVETARKAGDDREAQIKEVKLDLKNPLDLRAKNMTNEDQVQLVAKLISGQDLGLDEAKEFVDMATNSPNDYAEALENIFAQEENKQLIQEAGYDGIIGRMGEGVDEYVVFNTDQIITDFQEDKVKEVDRIIENKVSLTDLNNEELATVGQFYNQLAEAVEATDTGRSVYQDEETGETTVSRKGVNYPNWMAEEYKNKRVVESVLDAFINETVPKRGTRAYNLYNDILNMAVGEPESLSYETKRRRGEVDYGVIEEEADIDRNLDILRKDLAKKTEQFRGEIAEEIEKEAKGWLLLSDEDYNSLSEIDQRDYNEYLKPQLLDVAKRGVEDGEVVVIQSGTGRWVDTDITTALNRGVNKNTRVMVVNESDIEKTGNEQKDERGERLFKKEGSLAFKEDGGKQYVKTYDLNKEEDVETLEAQFGEETVSKWRDGEFEWGRYKSKEEIEKRLKADIIEEQRDYPKEIENSVVKDVVYHGSKNNFEEFSYKYLGNQGTTEGYGFYFTDNKEVASSYYSEGGKLFEVYLNIEKPLSEDKVTFKKKDLKSFIKRLDSDGQGYLSNYGDVEFEGYNTVLNKAIDSLLEGNENDVDLVHDIINAEGGNPSKVYSALTKTTGYDGIVIENADWGEQSIYLAFNNDQILDAKKFTSTRLDTDVSKESFTLETYEERGKRVEKTNLKIADEVRKLTRKYARKIGEKYVPKKTLGSYFKATEEIRLKGLTDFFVASHEIAHAIDQKNNITKPILSLKGNNPVRQELEYIYLDMYPNARTADSLQTKIEEGFATAISHYVRTPSTITEQYPHLVKDVLMEGGKYHTEIIGEYIKDLEDIIVQYQSLSNLDKIGTRLVKEMPVLPDTLYKNKLEEFLTVHYDSKTVFERLLKERGDFMTRNDYVQTMHFSQYTNVIVENNFATTLDTEIERKWEKIQESRVGKLIGGMVNYVAGKNKDEYWRYNPNTGNIDMQLDYNWGTLRSKVALKGLSDEFNYALVARRSYYDYQKRDEYQQRLEEINTEIARLNERLIEVDQENNGELTGDLRSLMTEKENLVEEKEQVQERLSNVETVIKNDAFDRELSTRAYEESLDMFDEEFEMYDELTGQDLEMLKIAGYLSEEKFQELKENKGYASFKRLIVDEVIGEISPSEAKKLGGFTRSGKSISSLKKRTGSTKQILYPVDSSMRSHQEITKKAIEQISLNMFLTERTVEELGDVMKPVDYYRGIENQENIRIRRDNGEKKAFALDPVVDSMIGKLTPRTANIAEQAVHQHKKLVTSSITGSYIQFALTNLPRDFTTYVTQTFQSSSIKAVYNLFANTVKVIGGKLVNNLEYQLFNKFIALGGQEMTFVKWMDGSYDAFDKNITREMGALEKITKTVGKIGKTLLDIVSLPAHTSELLFRATEFIEAKKSGDSDVVALEKAKRVTTPFHFKGTYTVKNKQGQAVKTLATGAEEAIDKYSPFAKAGKNAFIWVTKNFMEDKKIRKRMLAVIAITTALGLEELLRAWAKGSDDQKDQIRDLHAEDHARFIHMPQKDGQGLTRMALAEFAGGFGGFVNMLVLDFIIDSEDTNYRMSEYATALTASVPDRWNFLPATLALFNEDGFKEFVKEVGKKGSNLLPSVTKPLVTMLNRRTYPEVMPIESFYQKQKLPADRFNEGTSKLAKWALQLELPFSRERLGDATGLSPLMLDALLDASFGRSIGYLTMKPYAWDLTASVNREYYLQYGRRLNDYSEDSKKISQQYSSIKKGTISPSIQEQKEIYIKYQIAKEVDDALDAYRDAYKSKDLGRINDTRSEVLQLVEQFENARLPENVQLYRENPSRAEMEKHTRQIEREIAGDTPISRLDEDQKREITQSQKDFRQMALLATSEYSPRELLLISSNNDEKVEVLKEVKSGNEDPNEYWQYLLRLRKAGLLSNDTIDKMKQEGLISRLAISRLKRVDTNQAF